jgi:hypothetical protein
MENPRPEKEGPPVAADGHKKEHQNQSHQTAENLLCHVQSVWYRCVWAIGLSGAGGAA